VRVRADTPACYSGSPLRHDVAEVRQAISVSSSAGAAVAPMRFGTAPPLRRLPAPQRPLGDSASPHARPRFGRSAAQPFAQAPTRYGGHAWPRSASWLSCAARPSASASAVGLAQTLGRTGMQCCFAHRPASPQPCLHSSPTNANHFISHASAASSQNHGPAPCSERSGTPVSYSGSPRRHNIREVREAISVSSSAGAAVAPVRFGAAPPWRRLPASHRQFGECASLHARPRFGRSAA